MAKETKVRVDLNTFITAWEGSSNVAEVAQKTGLKPTSVTVRANKLRAAPYNIPLKAFARAGGGARIDVSAAKALLAMLRNTTVKTVDTESAELAAKNTQKQETAKQK